VAGVSEILAEDGRCLLVAKPANLKKWFATRLGRAKVRPGARPPTDVTPVARTLRYVRTPSSFGQRLTFERLMAERFPGVRRRDLKPAVYLRLDPGERFPRVTIEPRGSGLPDHFGPFRDRAAADKALHALHKLFPLRPCDFRFEPHPELPLGVGCLYAQVHTCAAPCLMRVTEEEYRGLAQAAAQILSFPASRATDTEAWLRPFVTRAAVRALVAEPTRNGLELYPVTAGCVGDAVPATTDALEAALAHVRWDEPPSPGRDEAWLTSWIYEKKRRGAYVIVEDERACEALAAAIRAAL
jgi:hypothetical protein